LSVQEETDILKQMNIALILNIFSRLNFFCVLFLVLFSNQVFGIYTEIGTTYSYKKNYFEATNNSEQQSTQVSISFFLWERIALETSYTTGLAVNKEKQPNLLNASLRTTTVFFDAYGLDVILLLSGRQDNIQPFLKAGISQIRRKIVIQDDNNQPWEIIYSGPAPGYGVGLKFRISEKLSLKTSYDILSTPSGSDTSYSETTGRIGFTWGL
jgi:hypothetical protein